MPAPAPAAVPASPAAPAPVPARDATAFDPAPVATTAPTLAPATPSAFRVGPADQPLLDRALAEVRRSPTARPILDRLAKTGIQMRVLDDAAFDASTQHGTAAYFDPTTQSITIRRSSLQKDPAKSGSIVVHEALHALDDIEQVGEAWTVQRATQLGGGRLTPESVKQAGFEFSIAKEARAYLLQGTVLRELGLANDPGVRGPIRIAAQGSHDRATYDQVFRMIVSSPEGGYNPEGRTAEPVAF